MDDFERVREVFSRDAYATQTTGVVLEEAKPGYARCTLRIDERHMNGAGTVMGGAIFTLADFAFAVAANYEEMNTQTLTSQITYLSAPRGGLLTASAHLVKKGRSTCYCRTDIYDETGRTVASVVTTGFISRAQ